MSSSTNERSNALYFKVLPPADALRHRVRYYWILIDDSQSPQIDEYLAPDGFEEIIFSYAEGFRREEICAGETQRGIVRGSYVVASKSCGVTCSRIGRLAMIGIKLWPQTLHSVLRQPLHELAGKPIALGDIQSPVLEELEDRLFGAESARAVKSILDEWMLRSMPTDASDLLSYSIGELFASRGTLSIDELIGRCGVHYRTLEKAFRERVGLPPKTLAKVLRFKHAFSSLSAKADAGRLGALECGYYDQSHFCKEFKLFTGSTPTRFFRERLSVDVARFCLALDTDLLNRSSVRSEFIL